jgi:peptide/nickel transport system ATP-binding protein
MPRPVIEAHDLKKHFELKTSIFQSILRRKGVTVPAVDGVALKIVPKEVLGLVGESGCGKTTTGKVLIRLLEPTEGKIIFNGTDITALTQKEIRRLRKEMQMIFQDPYESLNPRMSVYDIIAEPIRNLNIASPDKVLDLVSKSLEDLDLVPPEEFLLRFPHELSGGQRQRVAIARAFVVNPKFVVADEPTSMLDASIRSEVLKLISNLIVKAECAFLYITHDLALARYICDRIAVMYLGKIMEIGPSEEIILKPAHPYSKALLAAVPVPDPTVKTEEITLKEVPSALHLPSGCRFHTRCPYARSQICIEIEPELTQIGKDHYVACHFPLK